jgi:hypothetical protein
LIILIIIWRRVQVMKLLTMQFSPTSCLFIPVWFQITDTEDYSVL